jgi:hypothetical protein
VTAPAARPGPAASLPELPVTYRPVITRVVLTTIGAVVFGILALIALVLPASGGVAWGWGDRAAIAGSGLLVWAVLLLLCRPKVTADADGLTVVNVTARRRLAWAEIVRVNLRTGDPWVTLDLADGTVLAVMAVQPGVSGQRAVAQARSLRELAERHGTAGRRS